jgi:hypothetical protein
VVTSLSLKSDFAYLTYLMKAVLEGVTAGPKEIAAPRSTPVLSAAVWTPTAIGAAIGAVGAGFMRRRSSGYRAAVGGLLGSALGFGAGVGWISRNFTASVARQTMQRVNRVRDARWLEKNPINYA